LKKQVAPPKVEVEVKKEDDLQRAVNIIKEAGGLTIETILKLRDLAISKNKPANYWGACLTREQRTRELEAQKGRGGG
jgi:hypothetical protein